MPAAMSVTHPELRGGDGLDIPATSCRACTRTAAPPTRLPSGHLGVAHVDGDREPASIVMSPSFMNAIGPPTWRQRHVADAEAVRASRESSVRDIVSRPCRRPSRRRDCSFIRRRPSYRIDHRAAERVVVRLHRRHHASSASLRAGPENRVLLPVIFLHHLRREISWSTAIWPVGFTGLRSGP